MDAKMAEIKADMDAKMAEIKADMDAKMAEIKADMDAKMAENKADMDAKMAGIMSTLQKIAPGAAPNPVTNVRPCQRYTAEQKKKVLEWLQQNIHDPCPTPEELLLLRQQTGIDTSKRLVSLIYTIRKQEGIKSRRKQGRPAKVWPSWPKDSSEVIPGVNDTWNVFQVANKGRNVTPAEYATACRILKGGAH